jgi:protein-L-isoaspartate(D-aspartate) O-methyltransferase
LPRLCVPILAGIVNRARFSQFATVMMLDLQQTRTRMVDVYLARRGITDPKVLDAFRSVPREAFVPDELAEFAYEDTPLPIGESQTISQPYIVALTAQALRLQGGERVLEVGAGSGYAAAILSHLAEDVYTIERIEALAESAKQRLARLGFANVHVTCGDGSLGWPEHAPYDAIAVAAGGPKVPPALLSQLAIGGRLVIPVGPDDASQVLMRITRESDAEYREEPLTDVRFVRLIGEQGWGDGTSVERGAGLLQSPRHMGESTSLVALVREVAEPIDDIDSASVDALVERIGDARVVLLGEATHGTSEFYRMRARITRELIARRGFQFVAVEADWPDAARIDEYVLGTARRSTLDFTPFTRFPTWMWRNEEVHDFVDWLRAWNADRPEQKAGFHGLDLYSLFTSIAAVLSYLDEVDADAARVARHRYGSLTPWQRDPAAYGKAVLVGRYESSEHAVVAMLRDMLERRVDYAQKDGERFFDAAQNARLVADAERYYRAMYYGSAVSWNLRDTHMFDTLRSLLAFYGPGSKGIVWEHNSHVGDAAATEMSVRGEHNVGQLCRQLLGEQAYIIGFGTDHGTVAAASNWDEPMERMRVVPARDGSYERIFHDTAVHGFALHLGRPKRRTVRDELASPLLERAIGVVYRPQTEMQSHYFYASLPQQFDEYLWFDETSAVHPLEEAPRPSNELPDTYPFGL